MAGQNWITWIEALLAAAAGIFASTRVRRLPIGYMRDYLSDLAWAPTLCLVAWACLGGGPASGVLVTLILAPIIALRDVMFAVAFRNPPNDPSAISARVRRERDELRARLLGQKTPSDASID